MSNSAKDTREGVMDALGNVAKGAEDLVKEVVTEVRKNSGRLLRHHPRIPFFLTGLDARVRSLALKKSCPGLSPLKSERRRWG